MDGYTIKRGIGIGGFGEVYYATSDGGKDVALKRIQRNLDIELRGVRQCLNLKHHNLLALYDIKHDEAEQAWVVMEYVAGESLQQVIDRNPNGLPQNIVDFWFDGIAAGVGHLHDSGIVHRDLKPGNIFLDEGTIKVGDYGLSKFISCSRRSGQTQSVGTFHYMAPEIGQGSYGKEIDVYALGIILYEMLTGHVPFDGESSQEIIMKHLTAKPLLDCIPPAYRAVLARALAKDPKERFHSVSDMRAALARSTGKEHSPTSPAEAAATAAAAAAMAADAAAPNVAGHPAHAGGFPNEPIARAVHAAWRELAHGWKNSSLGGIPRLALLVVGVFFALFNAAWIIPYLGILAISYGVYLAVRVLVLGGKATAASFPGIRRHRWTAPYPAPPAGEVKVHGFARNMDRRGHKRRERQVIPIQLRESLAAKTSKQHATELTASLLMAALVAGVVSLVMALVVGQTGQAGFYGWAPNYVWLTVSSTLGAWAVLAISKMWESSNGDATLRRFAMMVMGILVGAASYGLAQFLVFQPIFVLSDLQILDNAELPEQIRAANGVPPVGAYLVFFAALFGVLRWWKHADPVRRVRLSILSTIFCVFIALIIQGLCPLPQGFMLAATTAIAVQMSAPWITADERRQLVHNLRDTTA